MKRFFAYGVCGGLMLSTLSMADPLTLEQALSTASGMHPERRIAESELAVARAEREQATSRQDLSLYLEGSARTGRRPGGDFEPDHVGRIVARKPLLDFGRTSESVEAADRIIAARQASLLNTENLRRLDIMARYFDVLLADMQYAADNELMAVTYIAFDNSRKRVEVGQVSQPELIKLEATFQDVRERRNASLLNMQRTRQKLAHAMYQPDTLPGELAEPAFPGNARPVNDYASILPWVMSHNPAIQRLQAQLAAADSRVAALRAEYYPTLDAEVSGGAYSRASVTRDQISAGLVFNIPLYQGGRVDARVARELALKERASAELDKLKLDLADTLLATLQEINWLRGSSRAAADKQIEYRDWALERARAEYELEMKTNLGSSMAETQLAQLRRKQVEYRLALAFAKLEALSGGTLPPAKGDKK